MRVLGIHDGTHDAGAAYVVDGVVVHAENEERHTRKKGQGGWPTASIAACLGHGPPDRIAFAGAINPNPALRAMRPLQARFALDEGAFWSDSPGLSQWLQFDSAFPRARWTPRRAAALELWLGAEAKIRGLRAPVRVHDHHLCHAAGAWYGAGGGDALVVVADGVGDGLALTVWRGREALRLVSEMPYPDSYGLFYASITGFLGFRPFRHEGKLVGLAATGDADAVPVSFPFAGPVDARRFTWQFGARMKPSLEALRGCRREDVAAWLQRGLEQDLVALVDFHLRMSGEGRLCLAGGVFANVRLNQKLAERVDTLHVHPHMGDGGLAVGAALAECGTGAAMEDVFLGSAYDDSALVDAIVGAGLTVCRPDDLVSRAAYVLARGGVVARFDGRMEYGPRALGNRSILAPATHPAITQRLNAALSRSEFMPFAPAILAQHADAWIEGLGPIRHAARFMTVTAQARPAFAAAPAAVHVDGSLRPQLVEPSDPLGPLIEAYHERTGVPVLINTSFNLHEEPIVATPEQAVRTFRSADLDGLVLGPYWVTRSG